MVAHRGSSSLFRVQACQKFQRARFLTYWLDRAAEPPSLGMKNASGFTESKSRGFHRSHSGALQDESETAVLACERRHELVKKDLVLGGFLKDAASWRQHFEELMADSLGEFSRFTMEVCCEV